MAEGKQESGAKAGGKAATKKSPAKAATKTRSAPANGRSDPQPPKTSGGTKGNLKKDLRDFASARPEGWNHDDWLGFLESLQNRGHNIQDREAIGLALEKERLDLALSGVKGMGPQRRSALIEKYGTLWKLRHADVSEIAASANLPQSLAESVKAAVQ